MTKASSSESQPFLFSLVILSCLSLSVSLSFVLPLVIVYTAVTDVQYRHLFGKNSQFVQYVSSLFLVLQRSCPHYSWFKNGESTRSRYRWAPRALVSAGPNLHSAIHLQQRNCGRPLWLRRWVGEWQCLDLLRENKWVFLKLRKYRHYQPIYVFLSVLQTCHFWYPGMVIAQRPKEK